MRRYAVSTAIHPTVARPTPGQVTRSLDKVVRRSRKGGDSMRETRPGVWELTATSGTQNGRPLRSYRTVMAPTAGAAARELAAFVAVLREAGPAADPDHRDLTVDDAMARFVDEHLAGEKVGRNALVGLRRSRIRWDEQRLVVDTARAARG